MASGPIGGNGCVCVVAEAVGNVVQVLHTFHHDNPVPPLGYGEHVVEPPPIKAKNEHGKIIVRGYEFCHAVAVPVPFPSRCRTNTVSCSRYSNYCGRMLDGTSELLNVPLATSHIALDPVGQIL